MKYKAEENRNGEWRWTGYARNGNKSGISGEGYSSAGHAERAARAYAVANAVLLGMDRDKAKEAAKEITFERVEFVEDETAPEEVPPPNAEQPTPVPTAPVAPEPQPLPVPTAHVDVPPVEPAPIEPEPQPLPAFPETGQGIAQPAPTATPGVTQPAAMAQINPDAQEPGPAPV